MSSLFENYYKNQTYQVMITAKLLNIRESGSYSANIVGRISQGEVKTILEEKENWGKIADGQWVCLDFVEKIKSEESKPEESVEENPQKVELSATEEKVCKAEPKKTSKNSYKKK